MKTKDLYFKWYDHALFGKGKEKSSNGNYFYRDRVMFYARNPLQRLVTGPNGRIALLSRGGATYYNLNGVHGQRVSKQIALYQHTDAVGGLGVFSRFEGDMLDDEMTHERVRYLMKMDVMEFVYETIPTIIAPDLQPTSILAAIEGRYQKYDKYSRTLGLKWEPLPDEFKDDAERIIRKKLDRYNNHKAVKARERARARREAVKVLTK